MYDHVFLDCSTARRLTMSLGDVVKRGAGENNI